MEQLTKLTLDFQRPNYAVTMYAVQNDRLTRTIEVTLVNGATAWTPPTGALGTVRYMKPDGTAGFYDTVEDQSTAVTWTGNVATVKIAEQMLTAAGVVLAQINFYTANAEKLTTFAFRLVVEQSPVDDETLESEDYFNVLTQRIADIMNAVVHPPQISLSGNWLLWDTETNQYVDSGVSAGGVNISSVTKQSGTGEAGTIDTYQCNLSSGGIAGTFTVYNGANGARGATGATGATGAAGASVTDIEKISGTGAGGTVDVYQVNLSTGGNAGTFNVYNGNDGSGSAGSATPLMDGTAAVGTANAYAREDHRHPSDTSKVDKVTGKGLSTNDFTDALKTKLDGIATGATANTAASSAPIMDGTAAAGTSTDYARADHVHPTDTTRQAKNSYFTNVSASTWTSNTSVSGYSYRCAIGLSGVTSSMYAEVIFDAEDALSGNYAPICETYTGGVYVWSKVSTAITIPTIVIMK